MGVAVERVKRGLRAQQAKGTGVHGQAAATVAAAESEAADAEVAQDASEKAMVSGAKSKAKAANISAVLGAVTNVGMSTIKGLHAGGGGGKGGGKGGASGGSGAPDVKAPPPETSTAKVGDGEKYMGTTKPKTKGLFAPLFSGGKVSTSGEYTEKGVQAQVAKSEAAGVDTNVAGVTGVKWKKGARTPAPEPKADQPKNPLYTITRNNASPPPKPKPQGSVEASVVQAGQQRTPTVTPGSKLGGQSVAGADTGMVAKIAALPDDKKKRVIAAMTSEQKTFYYNTLKSSNYGKSQEFDPNE